MDDSSLNWTVKGRKLLLHTPVYDVEQLDSCSQTGIRGNYVSMTAPNWVVVVPVVGDSFVLVRQYRHSYGAITTEFPGGVSDADESPEETAYRELLEETGYRAGKLTVLGTCSPNPALFSNRFTVCLAEDLVQTGTLNPDEDEVLTSFLRPISEVLENFCTGEYVHAFMGTALALYLRNRSGK